ncbi:RHS repeat-associated core domain-containing protein, partial [Pantoea agglomerans]|uniref:RHS repeat-associated core domain-containing protein n=1 Tax=Enterobacter agglomerans TaxID=549 RepID=UPI00237BE259
AVWTARSAVEADYKTVRYSGKERDATGLYYYGYRYYQPWAGRWLSSDPAGTVDGLNLYRMVRNTPIVLRDTDGRMPLSSNTDKRVRDSLYESEAVTDNTIGQQSDGSIISDAAGAEINEASDNKKLKFYRIDLSPPSVISVNGFKGNATPRLVKLFGDDTVFGAENLDGIDAFRAEVSDVVNLFGDAKYYYFERKMVNGYACEVQRPLYLYEISLPAEHPYHILSSFFKEENSFEIALMATQGEEVIKMLKGKGDELYQLNISKFREVLIDYSSSYNATKEVQIKGPIPPEYIKYIPPAAEVFLRQKDQASISTRQRLAA